jgi:AcrR family transcriptional regulator
LYRHFGGKEDLLLACTDEAAARFEAAVAGPIDFGTLAGLALEHRELAVLWQREARYLAEDRRRDFRRRLRGIADSVAKSLKRDRPELTESDADLLAWSVLAVLAGPSHHSVGLDRARFEALLVRLLDVVVSSNVPEAGEAPLAVIPDDVAEPESRREALLAAAVRLFSEQGYPSASMADVGSAAGIRGPSVYNHFANKLELLVAALDRAHATLQQGLAHALAQETGPLAVLGALLDSYLALSLEHSDLVGTLVTEAVHLPDAERGTLRQVQRAYVAQWVVLLRKGNPMPEPEARIVVHTVLTLVNDLVRVSHLRRRPNLAGELASLGRTLLAAPVRGGQ